MIGPAGEQARIIARWQTLLDSIGKIEDKAVTPFLTKLLGDVDVVQLSRSLQGAADAAETLGNNVSTACSVLRDTGSFRETQRLLSDIGRQFGEAFGIKTGNMVETIRAAYGKLNDALSWVDKNFQSILWWSKTVLESLVAINAIKFTAGIVSSITILSKAVMDLKTSALGAKGAMEGLSGAKGGLLGAGIFGEMSGAAAAAAIATEAGKAFDRTFKPPYYEPRTKQYDWSVISPEGMPSADLQKDAAKEQERAAETSAKSAALEALKAQQTATTIAAGASSAAQIQTSIAAAAAEARRLATILAGVPGLGTSGGAPPAPHVEAHALGGLYRRRHLAMIGESGPEAILPLSNRVRTAGIMGSAGLGGMTFTIAPAEVHIHGNADKATVQAAIDGAYRKVVNDIERILDVANERRSFEAFA